MNEVLRMTIRNQDPVDLLDFTQSCAAFAAEFNRFSMSVEDAAPSRLLIKEVRAGSIEIDLVQLMPAIAPLAVAIATNPLAVMKATNTFVSFAKNIKEICSWLKGEARPPETAVERKTLENIEAWLEPIAKDAGSEMNLVVLNIHGDNFAPITINSSEANVCQNVAKRKRKEMAAPQLGDVHEDVILRWHQSRNNVLGAGDMAIIESISNKPLRVIFQNKGMKSLLLSAEENMFNRLYLADVAVESVNGIPRIYRVLNIQKIEEET